MALRTTDAGLLTALGQRRISFTYLVELQFSDGTVRLWAGPKNQVLTYNAQNWVGTGDLGSLREIVESDDLTDQKLVAVLHASDANLDSVEIDTNEGRLAIFYLLLFDVDTLTPIGHLVDTREMGSAWAEPKLFESAGQRMVVNDLVMEFVGEGAILERRHVRRLTNADTREMDPNDNFNQFASDPDMQRANTALQMRLSAPSWPPERYDNWTVPGQS